MKSDYVDDDNLALLLRLLTEPNRLVCAVCLQTGLRISDALNIKTAALKRRFVVIEQKTNKKRRVSLSEELYKALKAQAGKIYVFEHRDDISRHRSRQAVYMDIKRAAKALRIKERVSPHSLRKHYAVELYRKYGFDTVRESLNHDNDAVTMLYAYADSISRRSGYNGKDRAHK